MKNDNIEALKSSVLVGAAYAAMVGGVLLVTKPEYACVSALAVFFIGFLLGILTTWYPED